MPPSLRWCKGWLQGKSLIEVGNRRFCVPLHHRKLGGIHKRDRVRGAYCRGFFVRCKGLIVCAGNTACCKILVEGCECEPILIIAGIDSNRLQAFRDRPLERRFELCGRCVRALPYQIAKFQKSYLHCRAMCHSIARIYKEGTLDKCNDF